MGWAVYVILSVLGQEFKTAGDFLAIPVVFFGPPIALLLCGLATGWAIRGFKSDEKPEHGKKVVQLGQGDTDDYVS
jgi:hypothetical protein